MAAVIRGRSPRAGHMIGLRHVGEIDGDLDTLAVAIKDRAREFRRRKFGAACFVFVRAGKVYAPDEGAQIVATVPEFEIVGTYTTNANLRAIADDLRFWRDAHVSVLRRSA